MVIWRAKIRLAATLVKESSVVIKDRPASALFAVFGLVLQIGHLTFFFFGMIFLSTAEITQDHFTGSGFPLGSSATAIVAKRTARVGTSNKMCKSRCKLLK